MPADETDVFSIFGFRLEFQKAKKNSKIFVPDMPTWGFTGLVGNMCRLRRLQRGKNGKKWLSNQITSSGLPARSCSCQSASGIGLCLGSQSSGVYGPGFYGRDAVFGQWINITAEENLKNHTRWAGEGQGRRRNPSQDESRKRLPASTHTYTVYVSPPHTETQVLRYRYTHLGVRYRYWASQILTHTTGYF